MGTSKPLISVIVLTLNEEGNLLSCLNSLSGLDYDSYVVDSGSTDKTVEIGIAAGANVIRHPFENYSLQRNWAQENLPLRTDWVLHLDAGERLTAELVEEIQRVIQGVPNEIDGYLIARRTIFLGRWIKHGAHYPLFHLRLFRRGRGRCENRLYDQHFIVDGKAVKLKNDFIDEVAHSLTAWSIRHVLWAEMEATAIVSPTSASDVLKGKFCEDSRMRRRWMKEVIYGRLPLLLRPFGYWFYRYFLRFGFLDGKEGLIFHFLQGFWFRFLVDCNIYGVVRRNESSGSERIPRRRIRRADSEWENCRGG